MKLCAARKLSLAVILLSLLVAPAGAADAKPAKAAAVPKNIVLIAGPDDPYHKAGAHEYAKTIATIKAALQKSNVAESINVVTVYNGWPKDPRVLDKADTIFITSAGADRKESDHPLLTPDRLQVLQQQMDRGCGLVMLHWSLFVPVKYEDQFTDWIGGFFDYERGDGEKGWDSAITTATARVTPKPKHPISRGIHPFDHHDEYYYNIHFDKKDTRITPLVTVELPKVEDPQIVAWTLERENGGRSFAFTGGHSQKSWKDEAFRTLMLNAICWTAKVPIPPSGVHRKLMFADKWTPRSNAGLKNVPHESEADWKDGRIREMNTGPYYTASIVVPEAGEKPHPPQDNRNIPANPDMVTDAIAIKLGGEENLPLAGVLFDKQTMVLRSGWTGGFLNYSDRRFGLLIMPAIAEKSDWWVPKDSRWTVSAVTDGSQSEADVEYKGLTLNGDRVVLSYSVGGCDVLESPTFAKGMESPIFVRTFELGPTDQQLELPLVDWPGAEAQGSYLVKGDEAVIIQPISEASSAAVALSSSGGVLNIDQSQETRQFGIAIWRGPKENVEDALKRIHELPIGKSLSELVDDPTPAPRWGKPLVTEGKIGQPEPDAPFAVDTVTIPYENPYGALFYLSGLDFAPDGTCYVTATHGDVWKVSGIDEDLDKITWQRFATGLYQPLGVVVRDGEVFVIGRDQITRLHDVNNDGEADYYESFNNDLTDKGAAHAYAMCLEVDNEGNFYFLKSGAKGTPHGGCLVKVSADGETMTRYATGFRNANGMSIGPKGTITAADNEGNWVPATRIDIVEEGEFCGYLPTAHRDEIPEGPGQPLCWLPLVVDNSAGGEAWVPEGKWGPLSGELLHFSYGLCTASLIIKEQVGGVWQGGAVAMPLPRFLSGICRGHFRTDGKGADGHLYVCGLDGWSSAAVRDGCLQRVRYLDNPLGIMTELHVHENGLELVFPEPINPELASRADRYAVSMWNYRWTKDYGSEDYSVADPAKEGRDKLKVTGAEVSSDGRRVFITVEGLQPVMQLRVQAGLLSAEGKKLIVDYYGTIHELRPAKAAETETAGR